MRNEKIGKPYQKLIMYTVVVLKDRKLKFLDLTGKAFKISKTRMCFFTKYPLQMGNVIDFRNRAFHCSHGIIMWVKKLGDIYLASARLIHKESGT
jgi:hypothetical protein